jgi:ribosomal-protein-alanine N-acetyltransferase
MIVVTLIMLFADRCHDDHQRTGEGGARVATSGPNVTFSWRLAGSLTAVDHVLVTDRLVLRPVTPADQAGLLAHWRAPQVRRFLFDGAVLPVADVTRVIDDSAASFAAAGYGLWLIHESGGRDLVGTAGLRPLDDLGIEVIYSLDPGMQGSGYATEAARAVVNYALGPLGLPEVLAEIDQDNAASAAVAQRLGMSPFEVVPGVLGPMTRYRKTR